MFNQTLIADKMNATHDDVDARDETLAILEVLTLCVIFVFALFGNAFVLFALHKQRQLRPFSRIYQLMAWLSFADLLVAVLNILPQLAWDITYRFKAGDTACKLVKYGQVFCLYLSTYVLLAMSFDRYLAVNRPNQWNSKRLATKLISVAFLLSFVFASPQLVLFELHEIKPHVYDCWANFDDTVQKYYVLWFTMSVFFVPLLLILLFYGAICIKIYRYRPKTLITARCSSNSSSVQFECTKVTAHHNQNEVNRNLSVAKIKTIKLTLTVVICFIICWSPFCITQLYLAFWPPSGRKLIKIDQHLISHSEVTIMRAIITLKLPLARV